MDLAPLLEPRSIAVVGANDRPGAYADGILRNLKRAGFEGPVWGVNPKRDEVHGFPCVHSLADLPDARRRGRGRDPGRRRSGDRRGGRRAPGAAARS